MALAAQTRNLQHTPKPIILDTLDIPTQVTAFEIKETYKFLGSLPCYRDRLASCPLFKAKSQPLPCKQL